MAAHTFGEPGPYTGTSFLADVQNFFRTGVETITQGCACSTNPCVYRGTDEVLIETEQPAVFQTSPRRPLRRSDEASSAPGDEVTEVHPSVQASGSGLGGAGQATQGGVQFHSNGSLKVEAAPQLILDRGYPRVLSRPMTTDRASEKPEGPPSPLRSQPLEPPTSPTPPTAPAAPAISTDAGDPPFGLVAGTGEKPLSEPDPEECPCQASSHLQRASGTLMRQERKEEEEKRSELREGEAEDDGRVLLAVAGLGMAAAEEAANMLPGQVEDSTLPEEVLRVASPVADAPAPLTEEHPNPIDEDIAQDSAGKLVPESEGEAGEVDETLKERAQSSDVHHDEQQQAEQKFDSSEHQNLSSHADLESEEKKDKKDEEFLPESVFTVEETVQKDDRYVESLADMPIASVAPPAADLAQSDVPEAEVQGESEHPTGEAAPTTPDVASASASPPCRLCPEEDVPKPQEQETATNSGVIEVGGGREAPAPIAPDTAVAPDVPDVSGAADAADAELEFAAVAAMDTPETEIAIEPEIATTGAVTEASALTALESEPINSVESPESTGSPLAAETAGHELAGEVEEPEIATAPAAAADTAPETEAPEVAADLTTAASLVPAEMPAQASAPTSDVALEAPETEVMLEVEVEAPPIVQGLSPLIGSSVAVVEEASPAAAATTTATELVEVSDVPESQREAEEATSQDQVPLDLAETKHEVQLGSGNSEVRHQEAAEEAAEEACMAEGSAAATATAAATTAAATAAATAATAAATAATAAAAAAPTAPAPEATKPEVKPLKLKDTRVSISEDQDVVLGFEVPSEPPESSPIAIGEAEAYTPRSSCSTPRSGSPFKKPSAGLKRHHLTNVTEQKVLKTGLLELHALLNSGVESVELPQDVSRKILSGSFLQRLLKGDLELKSSMENDVAAAQSDVRHLPVPHLLNIRVPTLDFQTTSGTHSARQNFLNSVDKNLFGKLPASIYRGGEALPRGKEAQSLHPLGFRIAVLFGAASLLSAGWGQHRKTSARAASDLEPEVVASSSQSTNMPGEADTVPTATASDSTMAAAQSSAASADFSPSASADAPIMPTFWAIRLPSAFGGSSVAIVDVQAGSLFLLPGEDTPDFSVVTGFQGPVAAVCDRTKGTGANRSLHWEITIVDPSRHDILHEMEEAGLETVQRLLTDELQAALASPKRSRRSLP